MNRAKGLHAECTDLGFSVSECLCVFVRTPISKHLNKCVCVCCVFMVWSHAHTAQSHSHTSGRICDAHLRRAEAHACHTRMLCMQVNRGTNAKHISVNLTATEVYTGNVFAHYNDFFFLLKISGIPLEPRPKYSLLFLNEYIFYTNL